MKGRQSGFSDTPGGLGPRVLRFTKGISVVILMVYVAFQYAENDITNLCSV